MSLSNYEVLKVLGKGAFGTVTKVKNKNNGLIYAMKTIYLMKVTDDVVRSSLNEIRLLFSLNHPNIINYKEAFYNKSSRTLNIILEFAGDGDLLNKVKLTQKYHKRIDENTIWDWTIQLIIGIYYLHSAKCIHRDLKPANIFLKKNGQIKIGDLNVSKYLKNSLTETITGTPLYMAPEIINNLPYDYKCDIWSLGCIIYELCSLEPPFNGRDMVELNKNIKNGRYIPIPNVYSNDLKKLIALMLQTNPNKRISSEELLYLPIIISKINQNYSRYQELIGKIKKPKIIKTILPQQKQLPKKNLIQNRSKSKNISKNKSKSKNKKLPKSARKKKVIKKNEDLKSKNRPSSVKRNYLRNYKPTYSKYSGQIDNIKNEPSYYSKYSVQTNNFKNDSKYSEQTNNFKNEPSYYSKYNNQNFDESKRDYDNRSNQYNNYNIVPEPSYYSKNSNQNYYKFIERNYDNKSNQYNNYNIEAEPSYYSKNSNQNYDEFIERNNDNRNNNDKMIKKIKFMNLLKDSFGPIKNSNYYEDDDFRPFNNANNYNNYKLIEYKNNYNNMPIKNNYIINKKTTEKGNNYYDDF